MTKQNQEQTRKDGTKGKDKDKDKVKSLGPDPTINKDLIKPELTGVEAEKIIEKAKPQVEVSPVTLPPADTTPKRTKARQAARDKALSDARQQIFHRVGKSGLALGEPVKTSRDEDLNESE